MLNSQPCCFLPNDDESRLWAEGDDYVFGSGRLTLQIDFDAI